MARDILKNIYFSALGATKIFQRGPLFPILRNTDDLFAALKNVRGASFRISNHWLSYTISGKAAELIARLAAEEAWTLMNQSDSINIGCGQSFTTAVSQY